MTDTALTTISKIAWTQHQHIISLRDQIESTFLDLGQALYEFKEAQLFRQFGHRTFEAYLADPDVNIKRRMAFMSMRVYAHYVLRLEYDSATVALVKAGISKLDRLVDYTGPENADKWINHAAALSRSDLNKKMRDEFDLPAKGTPAGKGAYSFTFPAYTPPEIEAFVQGHVEREAREWFPDADARQCNTVANFAMSMMRDYTPEPPSENHRGMGKSWWKKMARRYRSMYVAWYTIAGKAEKEKEALRQENNEQFAEIVNLGKKLDDLEAGPSKVKRLMENY